MSKFKKMFIDVIYWIAIVAADLFVYIILGLLLMSYDDRHEASQGEFWSWKNMNTFDRYAFVALYIWHTVNIIALIFVGFKIYKRLMRTTSIFYHQG